MRRGLIGLVIIIAILAIGKTQAREAAISSGIYDSDPEHIWNRIYSQFFIRSADNIEFGLDTLNPLLWYETESPLKPPAYQQTLRLLDEFLNAHAENLIVDPLKRALFQRDLWAVFDWLSLRTNTYPTERKELQKRIAQIMRRVALTDAQIAALPNNYLQAVSSHLFAAEYQPDHRSTAFLPPDLWQADSGWFNVGNKNGILAISHVQSLGFSGRSAFYVFYRVSPDRQATLNFIETLKAARPSQATATTVPLNTLSHGAATVPLNTTVGLVRQMLLIDTEDKIIPTSITESVELRVLLSSMIQEVYQFNLRRLQLFNGKTGGLYAVGPDAKEFPVFMDHGTDAFENEDIHWEQAQIVTRQFCQVCHLREDTNTIISYSRDRFPLLSGELPVLLQTEAKTEAGLVIAWKQSQPNWQILQKFWSSN